MRPDKALTTLEFDALTFAYDNSPVIFDQVSFTLPKTRAVWVRSLGGRGKSTLLKLLAGLLAPQQGRYLINGEDVSDMSFEQFLGYRLNMGYGFDMGGLLNNKTLAENLSLPLLYHKLIDVGEAFNRVEQVMDRFGMQPFSDQRPFAVSGSQRKLTCLLRAFMHWPQVVFLDDPGTGLKTENLNEMLRFVEEGFKNRGLKQIFFTAEGPEWARCFQAEELLISAHEFTMRSAA